MLVVAFLNGKMDELSVCLMIIFSLKLRIILNYGDRGFGILNYLYLKFSIIFQPFVI